MNKLTFQTSRVPTLRGVLFLALMLASAAYADGWPLVSPGDTPGPGQPTTPLFIVHSQNNGPTAGDWISASGGGGGGTYYSYFIEVPPATTNLIVEIFDPDVRQGGGSEGSAANLPHFDQQRGSETATATNYTLINPGGASVQTINGTATTPAASHAQWFAFSTIASPANGHWELRVDSLPAGGNVSGYGLRARATVSSVSNTQLRVYADAHLSVQNYGANGVYVAHPYVTGYCQVRIRDHDVDAQPGGIGLASSILLRSSTPTVASQNFTGTALSGNNGNWATNQTTIAWNTDNAVERPGIYSTELRPRSTGATNEFQVGFFNPNAPANGINPTVPAAGASWANSWRTYLPSPTSPVTATGVAPVKPYVTHRVFHAGDGSPNPPAVAQIGNYDVVVEVINPTAYPIQFSATNIVRAFIPGGQVVRAAPSATVSAGTIVAQPAVGGSGNVDWNPGTILAGESALLTYQVAVTPTAIGRIPVTGTPASNGTTARYLDETANTTQARATYTWGPLCDLAVTPGGSPVPTPATLAQVNSQRQGQQVEVELRTAVQVGVAYYELLEFDAVSADWIPVVDSLTPAPVDHLDSQTIRLTGRTEASEFMVQSVDVDGARLRHGPFRLGSAIGSDPKQRPIPWNAITAELESALSAQPRGTGDPARLNLAVEHDGIARLYFEDLPNALWSGTALSGLGLFHRGQPVPIRINSSDAVFNAGDSIDFIADRANNLYSKFNVYQLERGLSNPPRIAARQANTKTEGLADLSVMSTDALDADQIYNFTSTSSDPWHFQRLLSQSSNPLSRDYSFLVDDSLTGLVYVEAALLGGTDLPDVAIDHSVQISVNGSLIDSVDFAAFEQRIVDLSVPDGLITPGPNTLTLTLPATQGIDIVFVEKIGLRYARDVEGTGGRARFTPVGGDYANLPQPANVFASRFDAQAAQDQCIGVNGANFCQRVDVQGLDASSAIVMRRDSDSHVELLSNVVAENSVLTWAEPLTLGREILAADASGLVQVSVSAAAEPAELTGPAAILIISHPLFADAIQPLATRRQSQGLSVQTVTTDAAYTRFSGGNIDPDAIDQLIATAANENGTAHVLLVGGDSYDYHDRLGIGSISFLPSHYVRVHPVVNHAPSDGLYADLDGDLIPDLAIGRLPVRTVEELDRVLAKIADYEAPGGPASSPPLFIADDLDPSGESFRDRSEQLRTRLAQPSATAYLDDLSADTVRARLIDSVTSGSELIHYLGHSSPSTWTFPGPGLITPDELFSGLLSEVVRPTIVTQWGCWNSYLSTPENDSLGHAWLLSPGAAVAVIGSSSLTDVDHDSFLAWRWLEAWSAPNARIGQSLLEAKQDLAVGDPNAVDVLLGTTLFGDPTLPRRN